jgi:transketolase
MASAAAVQRKVIALGREVLRMTTAAGAGHPSSALSLAHIVAVLMYEKMRYDPADPWHADADRLVLSEGHAVPIIYAALADLGGVVGHARERATTLTSAELLNLRARASVLDGHPNPAEGFPFFDAATGSLGQGLSVAAGLACAALLDGSPRRIYCLVGDGESREGQIWEAADFIAERGLKNIVAIFNANGHGQAGPVSGQQSAERIAAKLAAFGWNAVTIDGHDVAAIRSALDFVGQHKQPLAIVARTVKGWGVEPFLTGNWHGKPLANAELDAGLRSLEAKLPADGASEILGPPPAPAAGGTFKRVDTAEVKWPNFAEALQSAGMGKLLEKGQIGTRRAYGAALKVAGDLLPQVVAVDGDVSNSTIADVFAKHHPERFFECKIAEQNMVSVGVGLAAAGFIPFANSFAKFIARAYDQVELASISRANLKLVGSHSGVTPCSDGPSQMGLLDVAYFRSFGTVRGDDRRSPLCWTFQPADALAAYKLTQLMVRQRGLCYMRTHRPEVPLLYTDATVFEPGGFHVLTTGDDIAIVSTGYMVHECRKAVGLLAKQNIRATLVDAYCLPIDAERLHETLRKAGGAALAVEDNYGGGLGSAVAEIAARLGGVRVEALHCQRIPKSTATPEDELDYLGLSPGHITDHAMAMLRRAK